MRGGERASPERAPDLVVIGEGDDIHPARRRPHDALRRLRTVTPVRVHVQIGPARGNGELSA